MWSIGIYTGNSPYDLSPAAQISNPVLAAANVTDIPAAFENQPLDALYCHPLYEDLNRAIAEYKATGNAQLITVAIDTRIARSLRSVDGLRLRGTTAQKQLGAMIDRGDYIFAARP